MSPDPNVARNNLRRRQRAIPDEILQALWKHGFEGVTLYVPRKPDKELERGTSELLVHMAKQYEKNGVNFMNRSGRPTRRSAMPLRQAMKVIVLGRVKAAHCRNKANFLWIKWWQDKELPRIEALYRALKGSMSESNLMILYRRARSCVSNGNNSDPMQELREPPEAPELTAEQANEIIRAARESVRDFPDGRDKRHEGRQWGPKIGKENKGGTVSEVKASEPSPLQIS
jgi:hypothetical protein